VGEARGAYSIVSPAEIVGGWGSLSCSLCKGGQAPPPELVMPAGSKARATRQETAFGEGAMLRDTLTTLSQAILNPSLLAARQ